ncbi:MAG: Asp-tRNA(Asn)/Glu-tRNA(Gln) amidotransferase subunit GatA, partial [Planctomycetes bacterium]|nr:Asp-tRNA(Asn)/Glu-tRNA(Gln) amidotransferase subunit GatA [Planctomycetota bacterium]
LAKGYYDAYYQRALKVRRLIRGDFDNAFKKCDFIMTPTSPMLAFTFGERLDDPLKMYLCDVFTVTANLAGTPGINVPVGFSKEGLPIGVQFLAPAFEDLSLLDFIEKHVDTPDIFS